MELLTRKHEEKKQAAVITIGCDLGQRRDPTAICVTEAQLRETGRMLVSAVHDDGSQTETPETVPYYVVRQLERPELGTDYPSVAARLAEIVSRMERDMPDARLTLVMDQTGVGLPVVEIVRNAFRGFRCQITGAVLTSTERMEGFIGSAEIRLGKTHLVSNLKALLQQGRIKMPETKDARACAEEILDFEMRVSDNANLITGAFKTGTHDDLVIALGLSVLADPRAGRVGLGPRVFC